MPDEAFLDSSDKSTWKLKLLTKHVFRKWAMISVIVCPWCKWSKSFDGRFKYGTGGDEIVPNWEKKNKSTKDCNFQTNCENFGQVIWITKIANYTEMWKCYFEATMTIKYLSSRHCGQRRFIVKQQ